MPGPDGDAAAPAAHRIATGRALWTGGRHLAYPFPMDVHGEPLERTFLRHDIPLARGVPLALLWGAGLAYLCLVLRHLLLGNEAANDFPAFYAASQFVLDGRPAEIFDQTRLFTAEHLASGRTDDYPWAYPPVFLLVVAPLATLPYLPALAAWLAATTTPLLLLIRRAAGVRLAVAISLPALAHNLLAGQNGALTASLILGGVLALERRQPKLAGLLFGLLAYKPQVCLLIPVCLLAGRHRMALVVMAATAGSLAAASLLLFGWDSWAAFFAHLPAHMDLVVSGRLPQNRFPTLFVALLKWTGRPDLARAVQAMGMLLAVVAVWRVWRQSQDIFPRLLIVAAALPLSTPFMLEYDLVIAAAPAAILFRRAARGEAARLDWLALAVLWTMVPAMWWASLHGLSIGLVLAAGLMAYALLVGGRSAPRHPEPP